MGHSAGIGKICFKVLDGLAQNVITSAHHTKDSSFEFGLNHLVLTGNIGERNDRGFHDGRLDED
jgi:hypothetical protein